MMPEYVTATSVEENAPVAATGMFMVPPEAPSVKPRVELSVLVVVEKAVRQSLAACPIERDIIGLAVPGAVPRLLPC